MLLCALALTGCLGDSPDSLTIATALPAADRARLENGFAEWSARNGVSAPIRWLLLASGDDLESVARHRHPPDVIIVGPDSAYAGLVEAGLVESADSAGRFAARLEELGLAFRAGEDPTDPKRLTFDDPRRDPISLVWLRSQLRPGRWTRDYGRLVSAAASGRPPGREPGAAVAAVVRGEARLAPAVATDAGPLRFQADERHSPWCEWAAVVKTARNPQAARAFLRSLEERNQATQLAPPNPAAANPASDALLADLLGATLVDAHDELVSAWSALERTGHPQRASRWMTEPLPWPPASVGEILKHDSSAMPLLETLAAQVAPEADVRAWLLRSWLSPARTIDGSLLDELAGAVGGRLVREPRFRAWLRAEWTASARQRYRRVARLTEWGEPP